MAAQRTSAAAAAVPALPALGGKKRSYRERVADALRAALIAGELRPGEVYSAPTLAARFGVSATPVREAMLDLAKEGLVDTVPNKGFRVTAVSERQLDEYTHIRALIEIPTVVEPGQDRRAGLAGGAAPGRPGDRPGRRGRRPHRVRRGRHPLPPRSARPSPATRHLVEVVGDLRKRSRLYGLTALLEAGRLLASAEEHLELLDALMARDEKAVREVMTRHLGHVRGLWAAGQPTAPGRPTAQ